MDERMRFVIRLKDGESMASLCREFGISRRPACVSDGLRPNDLWCTDYKGEFQLGDKRYCYPLTVTDHASRYLLLCEALESNREELALRAFDRLFRERGLPQAIRSDNGVPFASPQALFQLSKLSVWWLRLGITIERIRPGHPQQNGRHERMHLTLKKEATRPAGIENGIWLVSFMDYDLGYVDLQERTLRPLDNPFGPKV
jgi:transposase InsO family protein